jgi:hypothetical protein
MNKQKSALDVALHLSGKAGLFEAKASKLNVLFALRSP